MNLKVFTISQADQRWESFCQFIDAHPDSHFFQSDKLFTFIHGLKNYEPLLLVCLDESGIIRGSLLVVLQATNHKLLKYFSSGAIIRGGPLIDPSYPNKSKVINELLHTLIKIIKRKVLVIQFRNFTDQRNTDLQFRKFGFRYQDHQNLLKSTTSIKEAWKNLSKSRRRQITKSLNNGAEIIRNPSRDEVKIFYNILQALYVSKIHKPLPSWEFFDRFYSKVTSKSSGIVHLIRFQGSIIGGIICPISKNKMLHEWYICGMDKEYKHHGAYPSVLVTWSAIEYAASNNIPAFDFMGMGDPKSQYGVRDFKLRFGGDLLNFGRYERINNYPFYLIAKFGINIIIVIKYIKSWITKERITNSL